ncbi:hypothetical protein ELI24_09905 [Rhizobium ruizarguesonis]|jgi:hypothetical protein|uniref:hypothetical protein n=1 Tax=Rhizobium ruizarguesonis TaxID=2081791 RepID=UPI00102FDE48|nr:hypothetical protein [Rhizobium ruizarguesonis]NEJ95355.1 hypothetical protein [Rhizobium ruizarguesonis]TAV98665.1 hypothetical protein ELI24_09905 [Rhizobium ruizarguesonis]
MENGHIEVLAYDVEYVLHRFDEMVEKHPHTESNFDNQFHVCVERLKAAVHQHDERLAAREIEKAAEPGSVDN